jgi:hypothetical protein
MKKLAVLVVVLVCGVTASPAFGQATRTWVSGVGNDADPCSRTAPCKTFAGAISKTATGGIINAMDDGGFGTLAITKSLTVDGGGHIAGMLSSGGINAVNINIAGGNPLDPERRVVLRNLSIEGQGTTFGLRGVNISGNGAQTVEMENVRIANFSRHGIFVAPAAGFPTQLNMLLNNVVVSDTFSDTAASNAFEIRPVAGSPPRQVNAMVRNSVFKGSHPAPGAPAGESGIGIAADTGAHVWLSNSTVFDNEIGLKTFSRQGGSGVIDSFCDNQIAGNVDNGAAPNLLCPQPVALPAPAPTVVTEVQTVPAPTQCIVPAVKGLPVSFVRRLLKAANCALGRVTKKKTTKRSQVGKVMSQKNKPGRALANGAKINVTVGRR